MILITICAVCGGRGGGGEGCLVCEIGEEFLDSCDLCLICVKKKPLKLSLSVSIMPHALTITCTECASTCYILLLV